MFLAQIYVTLKPTINDPQGQTVRSGLRDLSFHTLQEVRIGKYIEVRVSDATLEAAQRTVEDMCRRLLANPVIEDFRFDLKGMDASDLSESGSLD